MASTIGCVQIARQHLSVSKTMSKVFSYIGRNFPAFLAILWFNLGMLEVIIGRNYWTAFYQFNLALAWTVIYSETKAPSARD